MKRPFLLFAVLFVFLSCQDVIKFLDSDETYKEYPVTIETGKGKPISEGIETFEAEVSVYRMNNRYDTGFNLTSSYNLLIEEIEGERATYIDYSSDNLEQKAVIAYRDSIIMFDQYT